MREFVFKGSLDAGGVTVETQLALLSFKEDETWIIYSPALDLTGYGSSQAEAKGSFYISLHEFLQYTLRKKTLAKELERLGWKIKGTGKKSKISAPSFTTLLRKNKQLEEIVNTKSFTRLNETVGIPQPQ